VECSCGDVAKHVIISVRTLGNGPHKRALNTDRQSQTLQIRKNVRIRVNSKRAVTCSNATKPRRV
jgi:hypothetical protein